MRILHVSAGRMFGGVETLQVTLARLRHLCPAMDQEFAVCYEGRFAEELRSAGVHVELLPAARLSRPLRVIKAQNRLAELLARRRYDIAITHMPWAHSMFGATMASMNLPAVLWMHGAWQNGILEFLASRRPVSLVVANSRHTAASLVGPLARVRVAVVSPPVERPELIDARFSVRDELSTPQDADVVVQASRLDRCKGHLVLLDALASLRELPRWVCWLVGGTQSPKEAEYFNEIVERAKRLGIRDRLRFLGQRRDVWRLLCAADIYCQPNVGPEGFGISFVEALYAGLPVVTSNVGGGAEIVDDTCGILADPREVLQVAEAIRDLLKRPARRKALARAAPHRARTLCDPGVQINRLYELLCGTLQYPKSYGGISCTI